MENSIYGQSTTDRPLGFFEHFFMKSGFEEFRNDFIYKEYKNQDGNWQVYNYEIINMPTGDEFKIVKSFEKTQISPDPNDYEENVFLTKLYLKNALYSKLQSEVDRSKAFIEARIQSFDFDQVKTVSYLKSILNDIVYYFYEKKLLEPFSKFPVILEVIYKFIFYLFSRYNTFLSPKEFPIYNEAEKFLINLEQEAKKLESKKSVYTGKKNKKNVYALKWVKSPEINTIILHGILTDPKIKVIETNIIEKLKTALSGEQLKTPLLIKWHLTKNDSIKSPIIRIFKKLLTEEMQLIIPLENGELAKALSMIFVNKDEKPAKNWIESISQDISNKPGSIIETKLIAKIRSAKFHK